MDIQKEREAFEAASPFSIYMNKVKRDGSKYTPIHYKDLDYAQIMSFGWLAWQAAKAQAVPEWIDYTKQSPRIDGRYQIFISGEQITADWQSPFEFSDPVEGEALIQDLISHWGMLPEPPKPQEPAND